MPARLSLVAVILRSVLPPIIARRARDHSFGVIEAGSGCIIKMSVVTIRGGQINEYPRD